MGNFLLWLDDERAPGRSKLFLCAMMIVAVGVGALIGVAVGAPGKGALGGVFAASGVGMVLGVAAFIAGKRSHHETTWQHIKRSNTLSSYGKERTQ